MAPCHGGVEVGVGEDDVRALAAQLEGEPLERLGAHFHEAIPDLCRAGERDLVHAGVLRQSVARGLAEAGDDVDHPGRVTGLDCQLAQAQRGQGGRIGRLEHDRTASGQRRAPLPGDHEQREVPGDDLPSDADRLSLGVAEVVAADGDDLALDLVGPAGVIAEAVDHERQVDVAALGDWLAVVKGLELGQLVDVLLDQVGEPVHQAAAIAGIHLAPGALGRRTPSARP